MKNWTSDKTMEMILYVQAHPETLYARTPALIVGELKQMVPMTRFYYLRELHNTVVPVRDCYKLGPNTDRNRQVYWMVKRGMARYVIQSVIIPSHPPIIKYFVSTQLGSDTLALANETFPDWSHSPSLFDIPRLSFDNRSI